MAWSYSGDPSTDNKDAVRWKIGDTDGNDEILQDEEIEYALANYSGQTDPVQLAAIECARAAAAKFARQSTYRIGQVSQTLSRKAEQYRELVDQLEAELVKRTPGQVIGQPVFTSVKEADQSNADLIQPHFWVGMNDRV